MIIVGLQSCSKPLFFLLVAFFFCNENFSHLIYCRNFFTFFWIDSVKKNSYNLSSPKPNHTSISAYDTKK